MAPLPFRKLHGCRNDYVVVAAADLPADAATPALARALCDRHAGVGADGLLRVGSDADGGISMRMWNPDGSEAEMCGNGLRCAVRFALEREGRAAPGPGRAWTAAGPLGFTVHGVGDGDWDVEIEVGVPTFGGPLHLTTPPVSLERVALGNPHAVAFVEDVERVPLATWGPAIERHEAFPGRTNVEFVAVRARDHLVQRTWERGAGETPACGTGAAAVWAAAQRAGHVGREGRIDLRGGTLRLAWPGEGFVRLRGPATAVFDGTWGGRDGRL